MNNANIPSLQVIFILLINERDSTKWQNLQDRKINVLNWKSKHGFPDPKGTFWSPKLIRCLTFHQEKITANCKHELWTLCWYNICGIKTHWIKFIPEWYIEYCGCWHEYKLYQLVSFWKINPFSPSKITLKIMRRSLINAFTVFCPIQFCLLST